MHKKIFTFSIVLLLVLAGGLFFFSSRTTLRDRVEQANELGKSWLFQNIRTKGLFVYALDPETGEYSTSNNEIRQLMASRVLAQESVHNPTLLDVHRLNLDFIFDFWYRADGDIGYVLYDGKSKLGGNAMLLRVLVASPLFDEYVKEAEALARGMLALQDNETGAFRAWYVEPPYAYDEDYLLTFYSGEALLALLEYHERTGDERWLASAERSADFYIDRYVTHLTEHYYPAYVPWHTLAYSKLYERSGDARYADAIFTMNDKLLELQDREGFVGRFYNPSTPQYGSPHGSSDAVYTEGLAYAYEVAKLVGDRAHERRYREAIERAVANLEWLQYQEAVPAFPLEPERYVGALRTRADSFTVRVDTTQHAVDAFTKLLEVL